MKKKVLAAILSLSLTAALLSGCGSGAETAQTEGQEETTDEQGGSSETAEEEGEAASGDVTVVKWFASRPVDGPIDKTIRQLAQEYSDAHDGTWVLEVETEADRPSYLEKLKTLIAGGNMPDIIDIDATPYCQELVDAGYLVDMNQWLNDKGLYDSFLPISLAYQEFTDGDLYTLPMELNAEMIWYNTAIFEECGIEKAPSSLNEWLEDCNIIKEKGYTPISVDGIDRWPVLRYLAMVPYAESKNDYAIKLANGEASMGDQIGVDGLNFYTEIGQYFQEGFAATDYATAQSMFLNGESAMYYIGTWEFAAMNDAYNEGKIDYFFMPSVVDGEGDGKPYCVNSGIGMAFNTKTFEANTQDFIEYVIQNYGAMYASYDQLTPIKCELPEDHEYSDLYLRVSGEVSDLGTDFMKPWDCYFDANTCTVVEDNMLLLPTGDMEQADFIEMVDDSISDFVNE